MQERINLAQWDNDNDPQMIKKIKDMNNMWFMYVSADFLDILLLVVNV
jgi:hypothetical protein